MSPVTGFYSANRLENPSAETGDLEGWEHENVEIYEGGVDGDYCFKVGSTGYLHQIVNIPGQPEDFRVRGFFLPEEDPPPGSVEVNAWIEVIFYYGDGTFDELRFPFRNDVYAIMFE